MHPLSTFPSILFLGPLLAPFILRLCVGGFLLFAGWQRYKKIYKWSSIVYLISGVLLILGLYTQISAIVGFLVMGFDDYADKKESKLSLDSIFLHSLCAIILLTLIFSGPGFFAFDLPL